MTTLFVTIETTAFSGATLLTAMLGNHPKIATVAEMSGLIEDVNPDDYQCSCGKRISTCEFWDQVSKGMAERGFTFDTSRFDTAFVSGGTSLLNRIREGSSRIRLLDSIRDAILFAFPGQSRRLRAMSARNEAFIETVLAITGKRVFLDSSKDRLRPKALQRFSSLDVGIIHMVRDVRGVVASNLRRNRQLTAVQVARAWRRLHQRVDVNLNGLPEDRHILLRYEDLCTNTAGEVSRLLKFCKVDNDLQVDPGSPLHLIGNPMRLDRLSKVKLDERWRVELTAGQLKEIEEVAGEMGRKYGYF